MDILLIDMTYGYPIPWLNSERLYGCKEIVPFEKYAKYEKYTVNGGDIYVFRGKFKFENGIISEVKDGD